ncbi:MAG: hypothetical protein JXR12_05945 [Neptunomonas phycophila]|uniref:hypothetical protein n=1 Tax=Neptunomonas phycophila TaxID=1572645 RepID=UPI003B8B7812
MSLLFTVLWWLMIFWIIISLYGFAIIAHDTIKEGHLGSNPMVSELIVAGVIGLGTSFVLTATLMIQFVFDPKGAWAEARKLLSWDQSGRSK